MQRTLENKNNNLFLIFNFKGLKCAIVTLLTLLWLTQAVFAQAPPNSTTAGAFKSGAAGSYPLSGFDNINYFNGNLGVNLPLATVGGRGDASFTMMMTVGDDGWRVDVRRELEGSCYPSNLCNYKNFYYPYFGRDTSGFKAGLGPGMMRAMHTGVYGQSTCTGTNTSLAERLTTVTFAMPGGATVELRDRQYDGRPMPGTQCNTSNGPSRGNIFDSKDGSGMTFVSDTAIEDKWTPDPEGVSGTLYLKNGVRYRIDNGRVSRITDRNGNWISFTYGDLYGSNNYVATDSLGRQTTVQTSANGSLVTITTTRQNNTASTVKIYPYELTLNGCQPLTYSQAFPQLNGAVRDWGNSPAGGCYGHRVELPDGRSYRFYYNQYSDLARIELPTGGAYEYDWAGVGSASGAFSTGDYSDPRYTRGYVYRRITERRIYDEGGTGANYTSKQTISGTLNSGNYGASVKEYVNGNSVPISRTDHSYFGDPMSSLYTSNPYYNEGWQLGREYQTDIYAGDGTQLLRRVQQTYQQALLLVGIVSIINNAHQVS
jgi:YD repeat-containing protein